MSWRNVTKRALFRAGERAGLFEQIWRDRAVVLAFHNVNDGRETPISVDVATFERVLDWLGAHFTVLRLEELVERLETGRDISRCTAITFDDGYLDNREIAAPLLLERGLPATFFVASDFVGTDTQTSWDTDHGVRSEWMTWDHVRELVALGFDIGGHTMSHANLGAVSLEEARREIAGGVERLERETGVRPTMFAYPYGRRDAITDRAREAVESLGLRCCCSCFGGIVRPDTSPMRLQRVAYSPWFRSPDQFGWEVSRLAASREAVPPIRR